jgi:hypothetical protein
MNNVTRILSEIITTPPEDVVALDEQAFSHRFSYQRSPRSD